jgi:hypothetical protein
MNDQELDQILETWTLAPPSPSLRGRMRSQYQYKPPHRFPLRGILIAAAAVFLISVLALSRTSGMGSGFDGIAFTVDMERTFYKDDGTLTRTLETCAQFPRMRTKFSTLPCWSRSRNLMDAVEFITLRFAPSLILRPETQREAADRQAFIQAGCVGPGDVILGYEDVAGYPTVKILSDPSAAGPRRITAWYAPDLGCFPLRATIEEAGRGGKIHIRSRNNVLAVHNDKAPRPSR